MSPTTEAPDFLPPVGTSDRRFFAITPGTPRVIEVRTGTYQLRDAAGVNIGLAQPSGPARPALQRRDAIRMAHSKEMATMLTLIDVEYGMTGMTSAATIERMRSLLITMATT